MNNRSIQDQIVKYLGDVHAIEEQALPQVKAAPRIAGDPTIADAFERHIGETENHEQRVRERLEALGSKPNKLKDVAGAASGPAFVLFAKSQPDTPGKLVTHAYSYEHMELAAYELLARVAERGHDDETVTMARDIAEQERAMAGRLSDNWDRAVEASIAANGEGDLGKQLDKYLADAHAIEAQALQMLKKAIEIGGDPQLSKDYEEHRAETEGHQRTIEQRLEARGAGPNAIKDAAMRLGAINWGAFFQFQPDTPAKLAGFSYAFEHLEIGAYEQLRRIAERANDEATASAAQSILREENHAAETLWNGLDRALAASLESVGVTV
jgi:ferritin-like metal-binding protein YciE